MKPDMFETPVTILTGLGMPTQIRSVLQAYRFLLEWPKQTMTLRTQSH
jgi:hypothetical protein